MLMSSVPSGLFTVRARALLALAICPVLSLVGCGGGGSSAATNAGAPSINTQPSISADAAAVTAVVTAVPAPTYPAGSNERLAFERLNRNRSTCGFGLLAQNAQLDAAAAAHVNYVIENQTVTHYETAGTPGFTGTSPKARAAAAGYIGSVGEELAAGLVMPSLFPRGDVVTEMLMDVPYHAVVALEGLRDVGIASGAGAIVMDPGRRTGVPLQSAAGVRTYPCDGITDVRPAVANEEPSPFPADAPGTQWGPTISVVGQAVRVSVASITGGPGSVAIKAILGDGATKDPLGLCAGANACVVPQPLLPGTDYQVHLEGTDAGVPFTTDFTFTTAPD
jgi:uncharacterized protein YkwD